jgi:outer membrane protein assembly factor BamA
MKAARRFFLCCMLLCLLLFKLHAQSAGTITPTDSSAKKFSIGTITIIGNKITKERIILRELTFHPNDSLDTIQMQSIFKRSEENLYNTSLFNSVHITWLEENDKMNVFILVTERWYIFPLPIFEIAERNFNVWWQTKDFSRIVYGGILNWNNFRGRNEQLGITLRLGYTQRISLYYSIPFINKQQKAGLTFGFAYSRNHQSSVKTVENNIIYYKNEVLFSKKEVGGSVAYTYRNNLYKTHIVETGYKYSEVLDTVVALNNDYFTPGSSKMKYGVLRYFFKSDHRDIAVYPLKGYYYDLEVTKNGFGFLKDDIDITYVSVHLKNFWPLTKRFNFGTGVSGKITGGSKVPYYMSKALGYGREFLRGYEYYVIDGQDYFLLKSNLKFILIPQKEIHAGFIPFNKFSTIPYAFYFNLYGDLGYVKDELYSENNPLNNTWQYGYGAGIDFVTYYDLVFRFEYSINKLGETGFFLHFTSPI